MLLLHGWLAARDAAVTISAAAQHGWYWLAKHNSQLEEGDPDGMCLPEAKWMCTSLTPYLHVNLQHKWIVAMPVCTQQTAHAAAAAFTNCEAYPTSRPAQSAAHTRAPTCSHAGMAMEGNGKRAPHARLWTPQAQGMHGCLALIVRSRRLALGMQCTYVASSSRKAQPRSHVHTNYVLQVNNVCMLAASAPSISPVWLGTSFSLKAR